MKLENTQTEFGLDLRGRRSLQHSAAVVEWSRQCARLTLVETATYLRDRTAIFWTFLYPVVLLLIMMALFGGSAGSPVDFKMSIDIEGRGLAADLLANRIEKNLSFIDGVESEVRRVGASEATPKDRVRLIVPDSATTDEPTAQPLVAKLESVPDSASGSVLALISQTASELNLELSKVPEHYAISYEVQADEPEIARSRSVYYVVGLAVLTIISTALFGFSSPLIDLRARGGLKLFQVMPVNRTAFLAAFGLCRIIILMSFVMLFIIGGLTAYGGLGTVTREGWLLLALLTLFGSITFLTAGLAIAGLVTNNTVGAALINVINLPIIFLSDLFIPLSAMPHVIQDVARAMPTYLLVEAMRGAAEGSFTLADSRLVLLSLIILFTFSLVVVSTTFRWRLKR
mgnify:CR=1 FL=1